MSRRYSPTPIYPRARLSELCILGIDPGSRSTGYGVVTAAAGQLNYVASGRNPRSALTLGQARGVAIAAAVESSLPVFEYAARQVKLAVVGTGRANKQQVQHMVQVLLSLSGVPQADAADALAIAVCHVNTSPGNPAGTRV